MQFKQKLTLSKYLSLFQARLNRQAIKKLFISTHKLETEIPRYPQHKELDANNHIYDFYENALHFLCGELRIILDCTHNKSERNLSFHLQGMYITTN